MPRNKDKLLRKAAIPADLPALADRYQIFQADIRNALDEEIPSQSVDWIITDPPYPQKFLPTFSALSKLASRVLKPEGGLIVMSGQAHLPEVITRLSEHMDYHWMGAYLTPGGQAPYNFKRKVNPFWKPILVYKLKGAEWIESFGDVTKTATNANDKQFHHWGQGVEGFVDLVERFSYPGQTILDPFLGGGTTAIATLATNRKFVGFDISEKAVEVSRARILEMTKE